MGFRKLKQTKKITLAGGSVKGTELAVGQEGSEAGDSGAPETTCCPRHA